MLRERDNNKENSLVEYVFFHCLLTYFFLKMHFTCLGYNAYCLLAFSTPQWSCHNFQPLRSSVFVTLRAFVLRQVTVMLDENITVFMKNLLIFVS